MVKVNLDNKQEVKRFSVEADTYAGRIVEVSDIKKQKGFEEKEVEKLRVIVELDFKQNGENVKLPYFLTASVSHASKRPGYSDSKLYTLLELAKELDNFKVMWETVDDKSEDEKNKVLVEWLRSKLLGRKVKIMTKTVKGTDGSAYSVVHQVVKFDSF